MIVFFSLLITGLKNGMRRRRQESKLQSSVA